MDIVIYDVQDFPFDKIKSNGLDSLRGNTYISPLTIDDNSIYVKLPRSSTKNGIQKTSKKMYTQLLFDDKKDTHFDTITWFDNLEKRIKKLILEKKEEWFQTNIDAEDIEQHWVSNLRTLRNKTPSNMLQCFIPNSPLDLEENHGPSLLVFDENEKQLSLEEVDNKCENTCLIEISRLKFTPQTFKIDVYLRQLMIHSSQRNIIQNRCLLGNSKNSKKVKEVESMPIKKTNSMHKEREVEEREVEERDKETQVKSHAKETQVEVEPHVESEKKDETVIDLKQESEINKIEHSISTIPTNEVTLEILDLNEKMKDGNNNKPKIHLDEKELIIKRYQLAKKKAKETKEKAILAYLEWKKIKADAKKLIDLDESDSESDSESESESDSDDDGNYSSSISGDEIDKEC